VSDPAGVSNPRRHFAPKSGIQPPQPRLLHGREVLCRADDLGPAKGFAASSTGCTYIGRWAPLFGHIARIRLALKPHHRRISAVFARAALASRVLQHTERFGPTGGEDSRARRGEHQRDRRDRSRL